MEFKEKQQIQRQLFQDKAVELSLVHPFLAIEAATSTGKGLSVMKCIEADTSDIKWLILVPESLQIINFQDDVKKHRMEHIYDKIEAIICYASLHKYKNKELSICLNECHRLSECRTNIAETIKYKRIIADSATISDDIKFRLNSLGNFYYFKLSLKSAIEKGILATPTVYIIPVKLDNYQKRNKGKFGDKLIPMTDEEYVLKLRGDLKYWSKRLEDNPKQIWIKNKFKLIGLERKQFFAKCKTLMAFKLLEHLKGRRLVVYTGSTEQCDVLGGNNAIHSKKSKKHNAEVLRKFNEKEINTIFFNKIGSEGMNFSGLDAVVIIQLSTGNDNGLSTIQKGGRSFRSEFPEIYLLYCETSKDEEWMKEGIKIYNPEWVQTLKL